MTQKDKLKEITFYKKKLTKALALLENQSKRIAELEEYERNHDLNILKVVEYFQEDVDTSLNLPSKVIRVINKFEENQEIIVSPLNIVSIASSEDKRRKILYLLETVNSKETVNEYKLTTRDGFERLMNYFDKLNRYLVRVSQDAVINIAFYEIGKRNLIVSNSKIQLPNSIQKIKTLDSLEGRKYRANFEKVKSYHSEKTIMQKKIESVRVVFSRK